MALEMELCVLFLKTFDTRVLGPPKIQEGEEEKGFACPRMGLVDL
jgi:hypothetical protein